MGEPPLLYTCTYIGTVGILYLYLYLYCTGCPEIDGPSIACNNKKTKSDWFMFSLLMNSPHFSTQTLKRSGIPHRCRCPAFQRLGTHNFVTISRIVRVLFLENPRRGFPPQTYDLSMAEETGGTGGDLPLRAPSIPFPGWDPGDQYTGWSINNRTILNCSHFLARQYFFNPFSPKRSIHTGKLRQQHEFTNASFIILVRCHFVSPYYVDGSATNVLCRGGHFCEIAGIIAD